jgi:hypothetical protein
MIKIPREVVAGHLGCITFDDDSKIFILDAFNKGVDTDGFICERSHPHNRVLTPDGEEIHIDEWGGIRKGDNGGFIFFKNDLVSLIKLSDALKKKPLYACYYMADCDFKTCKGRVWMCTADPSMGKCEHAREVDTG